MKLQTIKSKKGTNVMYQVLIHLILIALIFAMFFLASVNKVNSRTVKQQVLEKQTALLIDSAVSGTTISVFKNNKYGRIDDLHVKEGKVYASVDGLAISKGYPYFTKYSVSVDLDGDKWYVRIK